MRLQRFAAHRWPVHWVQFSRFYGHSRSACAIRARRSVSASLKLRCGTAAAFRNCRPFSVDIGSSAPTEFEKRTLGSLLTAKGGRKFVFVGGKGGVGKTSTAAAVALGFARSGRKTLVVSTDPAHSLGDALAVNLQGEPTEVPLDCISDDHGALFGMEIDPAEVVDRMRKSLNVEQLRQALKDGKGGLGTAFLDAIAAAGVDLEVLTSMLELSPPGIDEAVALAQLVTLLQDERNADFECIVIDTAPTGHTLRLLAFPRFLHTMTGTLLSIQEKVAAFNPVGSLFGGGFGQVLGEDLGKQLRITKDSLERMMVSMESLNKVFADSSATTFIVVTIPTHLAVAESRRLLAALQQAQMPARHVIVNQVPFMAIEGSSCQRAASAKDMATAIAKLEKGRDALNFSVSEVKAIHFAMERLQRQCCDADKQIGILESELGPNVQLLRVPIFDEELTGVHALNRYARLLCDAH